MGGSHFDLMTDLINSLLQIKKSDIETLNKVSSTDPRYVSIILGKAKELKIFQNKNTFNLFEASINKIKKANVSQVYEFSDLPKEFQFDQIMKKQVNDAIAEHKISKMRYIRGDGNCLYRSIMFGYLEKIIFLNLIKPFNAFLSKLIYQKVEQTNNSPSRKSGITLKDSSIACFTIYSLGKVEIAVKIINKVISSLEIIDKLPKYGIENRLNALYLLFIFDEEFDISAIRLLRIMIFIIVQANSDMIVNDVPIFFLSQTKNNNIKEIEKLILTDGTEGGILSQYLSGLFLGINIETLLLDTNSNNQKAFHQTIPSCTNQFTFPLKTPELCILSKDHIFLLLKPGHYDFIYKANIANSNEFFTSLKNQKTKFGFLERIFYANLNNLNPNFVDIQLIKQLEKNNQKQNPSPSTKNNLDNYPNKKDIIPSKIQNEEDLIPDDSDESSHNVSRTDVGLKMIKLKCQDSLISKAELKNALIEENSTEDYEEDIFKSYKLDLVCPKCRQKHSFQEWKKILGDRDYNEVIDLTLRISKEKRKKISQSEVLGPKKDTIVIKHICKKNTVMKSDYIADLEKCNKDYFMEQKKQYSNIYQWYCPFCKQEYSVKQLEEMIGKVEVNKIVDKFKNNMDPSLSSSLIKIHEHSTKKEDFLINLLNLNANEPYIYDIYSGNQFKCCFQGCDKKIKINELTQILGEKDTKDFIAKLNLELRKKPKSKNQLKFHCGIIDYEQSLKIGIEELIEYNKKLPKSKAILCFRCNREISLSDFKKMQIFDSEIKKIFEAVGIISNVDPMLELECNNKKPIKESEFIEKMINKNAEKFQTMGDIANRKFLYCPFCKHYCHYLKDLNKFYNPNIIEKICVGIVEKNETPKNETKKEIKNYTPKSQVIKCIFHKHDFNISEEALKEDIRKKLFTNAFEYKGYIIFKCPYCGKELTEADIIGLLEMNIFLKIKDEITKKLIKAKETPAQNVGLHGSIYGYKAPSIKGQVIPTTKIVYTNYYGH